MPRLGGNKRTGIFSMRSPFRANNLGLSVIKLDSINQRDFSLTFSGVDVLSGSSIYDLKPYVPYADNSLDAQYQLEKATPSVAFSVIFYPRVEHSIRDYHHKKIGIYTS